MRTMTMIRTKRDGEDKYEEVEVREGRAGVCLYNPHVHSPTGPISPQQVPEGAYDPIPAMPVSHSEPRARLPTLKA